jgi:hypothetical protein
MAKSFEEFKEEVANDIQELKSVDIDMGFNPLGCVELAEQKAHLMKLMINNGEAGGDSPLEGILNLIDVIQDQLQDYWGFDEEVVFPYKNHPSSLPEPVNYKQALEVLLKELPLELLPKYLNIDEELTRVLKLYLNKGSL